MKNLIILYLLSLAFLAGCSPGATQTDFCEPSITLTSPAAGAYFCSGESILLSADASDIRTLHKVEFMINGQVEISDNDAPYEYFWDTTGIKGTFTIFARAYDAAGNTGESEVITIHIHFPGPAAAWAPVEAGEFTWSESNTIVNLEHTFQIMDFEVNNAQFTQFLNEANSVGEIIVESPIVAGYYTGDEYYAADYYPYYDLWEGYGHILWNGGYFSLESGYGCYPVVKVSWFGANAFAEFYGWRLPSEQEWEKVARGNTGFAYPWGDTLCGYKANYWHSGDPWDEGCTPVGFYNGQLYDDYQTQDSPSVYGCYDMCGNVYEWTLGWFNESSRILRGGSWSLPATFSITWSRYPIHPAVTEPDMGFRCVKN
ncbi:MAG: SUMF1/EgtB/PvdO family nonheme iron enzyme [Candidatus Cloacimonetes bacterium]|nr:SUMF1/EgtB/PvdO family nonheme iron enzyme [Candidatus Cloacimonadota bacterium]